jgi:geranylgeranyl diphosphate synthase type II
MTLKDYTVLFSKHLESNYPNQKPHSLYEPMQYILELGGKRIRPVLTLIAADGFGGTSDKALAAAMAVEVFHNFTLLHDDIMDQAPIRRGKPTVHQHWNTNTAILSGDVMMIKAFQYLNVYDPEKFTALTQLLSKTAVEVCEGQQYDMDFETKSEVTLTAYREMIRLKTAVLLGAALQMGAIVADAGISDQHKIYEMGVLMGLAFQMQDDYLDTFGNAETFGKQIGGDIVENKKTWLVLKTLELADDRDKQVLTTLFNGYSEVDKIEKVKDLFKKYSVDILIQKEMEHYTLAAEQLLNELPLQSQSKIILETLMQQLKSRTH